MEAVDGKREGLKDRAEYRDQEAFADALDGEHALELGHLIDGDLNGDGVLGVDDIVAWMQGQRPPAKTTRSRTSLER